MKKFAYAAFGGTIALAGVLALSSAEAQALTVQECSAKYNAAKAAGTLGDKTWNDYRKAECGDGATAAAAASEQVPAAKPAPSAAGSAVFPSVVSPKYASERVAKARMHTCLDQYKANKSANANGGLKWIMKGGGYYSECNKRLKATKA